MSKTASVRYFPSINPTVFSRLCQQVVSLKNSVIPLLPSNAQKLVDDLIYQMYPQLPVDVQEVFQHHLGKQTSTIGGFNNLSRVDERGFSFLRSSEDTQATSFSHIPHMAAVLVPLCHQKSVPSILFTVRSFSVGTHQGQVAFPGGHLERHETAQHAAIRETEEELGSTIGKIKVIGYCTPIFAITGTLVFPILGYLEKDVDEFRHLILSKVEVDKVFCLSVNHLLNSHYRSESAEVRFGSEISMPMFTGGPEPVWGLTALILDGIVNNVLLPIVSSESSKL